MRAALLSLAERAAKGLGRGDLSQVYIEGENGTVFLVSAQDEAVLIAVTAADAKVGMMLYEVKLAASRVGEVLRGPAPLPAPLPSHVTRGYLDAHDNGSSSNGSNGVAGSYSGYPAPAESYESTASDTGLADLPYSESAYDDASYSDADASPLYSELTHTEPSYTQTSYDEYAANDEVVEATDTLEEPADIAVSEAAVDAESPDVQAETGDAAAEVAVDDAVAVDADDEDDESGEVYPDRVYSEVVYTEASLTEPSSAESTDSDDSEVAQHETAAATPLYSEPSYYTEPSYYAEPALPDAPPAEQPGWSSYAPSGSVLPGGQAWS